MDEAVATGFSLFYLFTPTERYNCERPALWDQSVQHPSSARDNP